MFCLFIFAYIFFQPVAIVVPHHNLVQAQRQQLLSYVSRRRLLTRHIVLISPDHFSQNQSRIVSSTRDWNLSTGTATYKNLLEADLPQNDLLLRDDHGIYNPLSDLKKYFPHADFEPIIIGQKTTPEQLQTVINNLRKKCHLDCLLVASVDFSHYLPATLAEVHDTFTINSLQNLNSENILKSEVDSPQSLYILASFAKSKKAYKWTLFDHTNSGFLSQNPDIETTTHVFGYYSKGQVDLSGVSSSTSIPYPLSRSDNQLSLGDRFFYGVDNFSSFPNQDNFVVSEVVTPTTITKSYLPLADNLFVKGVDKQKLIKSYFDSITDPTVVKDYFWGKLVYERKN